MNHPLPLQSRPRPDVDPRIALVPLPKLFAWLADKSEAEIRANLPKQARIRAASLAQGMAAAVGETVAPPPPRNPIRREIVRTPRESEIRADAPQATAPPPGSAVAISRAGPPGESKLRTLATIPGAPPREAKAVLQEADPQRSAPSPDAVPVLRAFPLGNTQPVAKGQPPEPPAAEPAPDIVHEPVPEPVVEHAAEPLPDPEPGPEPELVPAHEPVVAEPQIPQGMLALPPGAAELPLALPPPLSAPKRSPPPRMTRADDFLPSRPGQLFPDGV